MREAPARDPAWHARLAVLCALAGDRRDAEIALSEARGGAPESPDALVVLTTGLALIEAGEPDRARTVLQGGPAEIPSDPAARSIRLLLEAQAQPAGEPPAAARRIAADALRELPDELTGHPLGVYGEITAARLALASGDPPEAAARLDRIGGSEARSGLLSGRADLLLAQVRFALERDASAARSLLDRAIACFNRIGAPRDLAFAYLARAALASADPQESHSSWLGLAEPLLARCGGARDLELLRRAFRDFGRRIIGGGDVDIRRIITELGGRRSRLEQVLIEQCEPAGQGLCRFQEQCAGYRAFSAVLEAIGSGEEQLITALGGIEDDRARLGQLAFAAREIASHDDVGVLRSSIPELALGVCRATSARLLAVPPRTGMEVLSEGGAPFQSPPSIVEEAARRSLEPGRPPASTPDGGRLAAIPLARDPVEAVLVVERAADAFSERDLELLAVYAVLAGASLSRLQTAAAMRDTAARDAATLAAIRDGVIAVDQEGVLRAVNQAAAGLLGLRREDALGLRLREIPGLQSLAVALAARPNQVVETVALPRTEVVVRPHPYPGGVVATIRDAATEQSIAHRLIGSVARFTFDDVVGQHPALAQVIGDARSAAVADVPVLITGESGTGKELLAQAIHNASAGASHPFVAINVTAIPRELLESELFGYEGGAFTGARSAGRAGKLELVGRGTLLLDEVGDMPLEMQGKLLRVLQERVVQRLGSARDIRVRARIITTTHIDLEEAVKRGRFRLDLYHRLRVVHLRLPPLREHKSDVRLLIERQLRRIERISGRKVSIAPAVLRALEGYDWPGNVRELENLIDAEASLLPPGQSVIVRVPVAILEGTEPGDQPPILSLTELERHACEEALTRFGGNVTQAARALGMAKGTLYTKMKRYHIQLSRTQGGRDPSFPARRRAPRSRTK